MTLKPISIDREAVKVIEDFAKEQNISFEDAMNKLVATASFFYDLKKQNHQAKIYIANDDNNLDEITLK